MDTSWKPGAAGSAQQQPDTAGRVQDNKTYRVLVVDEDVRALAEVGALLQQCSYEAVLASSGNSALASLQTGSTAAFDLVLADVERGKPGSLSLLSALKKQLASQSVPVVVMSADSSQANVVACLDAGAADFLTKPVRRNELSTLWRHAWRLRAAPADDLHRPRTPTLTDTFNAASTVPQPSVAATENTSAAASTAFAPRFLANPTPSINTQEQQSRPRPPQWPQQAGPQEQSSQQASTAQQRSIHLQHQHQHQQQQQCASQQHQSAPQPLQFQAHQQDFANNTASSAFYSGSPTHSRLDSVELTIQPLELSLRAPAQTSAGAAWSSQLQAPQGQPMPHRLYSSGLDELAALGHRLQAELQQKGYQLPPHGPLAYPPPPHNPTITTADPHHHHAAAPPPNFHHSTSSSAFTIFTPGAPQMSDRSRSGAAPTASGLTTAAGFDTRMGSNESGDAQSSDDVQAWPPQPAGRAAYQASFNQTLPSRGRKDTGADSRATCALHRKAAIAKFKEKRKARNFDKKVRYASRKRLAEARPRVRGQFVKAAVAAIPADVRKDEDSATDSATNSTSGHVFKAVEAAA